MKLANWPFNKLTFFASEAPEFKETFRLISLLYPLPSRETVPLGLPYSRDIDRERSSVYSHICLSPLGIPYCRYISYNRYVHEQEEIKCTYFVCPPSAAPICTIEICINIEISSGHCLSVLHNRVVNTKRSYSQLPGSCKQILKQRY